MNILKRLSKVLKDFPMKSIFITLIIVILLAIGVKNVFMATGNDTLVKSSTDVYKDNLIFEEEFGGESIIVLYESENLLTPDNLAHMKGLENALQTSNSIYSMISPVSLVEEIADKQSNKFKEGMSEVIDGLDSMGNKLIDIGTELRENAKSNQVIEFPELGKTELPTLGKSQIPEVEGLQLPEFGEIQPPDIEGQIAELNKGFSNIIGAQENLGNGTKTLIERYTIFGDEIKKLGENLSAMSKGLEDNSQLEQLQAISLGLIHLSDKMAQMSKETSQLTGIPAQTIDGLKNIQQKLSEQLKEQEEQQVLMQKEQEDKQVRMKQKVQEQQAALQEKIMEQMQGKQEEQAEKLSSLGEGLAEMGGKLQTIIENMKTIYDYSDVMTPGLPNRQTTLDNMIYDDGELRPMFKEVIVDNNHMLMIIRFKGNTSDAEKSEVVETINMYLDAEQNDLLITMVSGKPVLDNAIRSSMKESMQIMLVLALTFMIIVLFLVFNVSWRLLPLVTVLVAVVGTIGAMGWLNIPITMVSMAVFPILIGLGIDYGIQFQNRYNEEMSKEEDRND